MEELNVVEPRDIDFFRFVPEGRLKIPRNGAELGKVKRPRRLLAVSSKYDLVLIGSQDELSAMKMSQFREQSFEYRTNTSVRKNRFPEPESKNVRRVKLPGEPVDMELLLDERTVMIVCAGHDGTLLVLAYDVATLIKGIADHDFEVTTVLVFKYKNDNLMEAPVAVKLLNKKDADLKPLVLTKNGSLKFISIPSMEEQKTIYNGQSDPARSMAVAGSGTIVFVGMDSGVVKILDTSDGSVLAEQPCIESEWVPVALNTISPNEALASYMNGTDVNHIVIKFDEDANKINLTPLGEIFFCFGPDEEEEEAPAVDVYVLPIPSWQAFVIGTSLSGTVELVVLDSLSEKWTNYKLNDENTVTLPMNEDDEDTVPLGLALDLANTSPVPGKDAGEELQPMPRVYVLTSEGLLLTYALVDDREASSCSAIKPSEPPPSLRFQVLKAGDDSKKAKPKDGNPTFSKISAENSSSSNSAFPVMPTFVADAGKTPSTDRVAQAGVKPESEAKKPPNFAGISGTSTAPSFFASAPKNEGVPRTQEKANMSKPSANLAGTGSAQANSKPEFVFPVAGSPTDTRNSTFSLFDKEGTRKTLEERTNNFKTGEPAFGIAGKFGGQGTSSSAGGFTTQSGEPKKAPTTASSSSPSMDKGDAADYPAGFGTLKTPQQKSTSGFQFSSEERDVTNRLQEAFSPKSPPGQWSTPPKSQGNSQSSDRPQRKMYSRVSTFGAEQAFTIDSSDQPDAEVSETQKIKDFADETVRDIESMKKLARDSYLVLFGALSDAQDHIAAIKNNDIRDKQKTLAESERDTRAKVGDLVGDIVDIDRKIEEGRFWLTAIADGSSDLPLSEEALELDNKIRALDGEVRASIKDIEDVMERLRQEKIMDAKAGSSRITSMRRLQSIFSALSVQGIRLKTIAATQARLLEQVDPGLGASHNGVSDLTKKMRLSGISGRQGVAETKKVQDLNSYLVDDSDFRIGRYSDDFVASLRSVSLRDGRDRITLTGKLPDQPTKHASSANVVFNNVPFAKDARTSADESVRPPPGFTRVKPANATAAFTGETEAPSPKGVSHVPRDVNWQPAKTPAGLAHADRATSFNKAFDSFTTSSVGAQSTHERMQGRRDIVEEQYVEEEESDEFDDEDDEDEEEEEEEIEELNTSSMKAGLPMGFGNIMSMLGMGMGPFSNVAAVPLEAFEELRNPSAGHKSSSGAERSPGKSPDIIFSRQVVTPEQPAGGPQGFSFVGRSKPSTSDSFFAVPKDVNRQQSAVPEFTAVRPGGTSQASPQTSKGQPVNVFGDNDTNLKSFSFASSAAFSTATTEPLPSRSEATATSSLFQPAGNYAGFGGFRERGIENEKEKPKASLPPMGSEKETPKAALPPMGSEKETPKAALPPMGSEKEKPKASLPPMGSEKETPKAALPPMGSAKETPKAALPPMGSEKETPKAGLPPMGSEKEKPKATLPPLGSEKEKPKASLPPMGSEKELPKATLPPMGSAKETPKAALPPLGSEKETPKAGLPPMGSEKEKPNATLPPLGSEKDKPATAVPSISQNPIAASEVPMVPEKEKTVAQLQTTLQGVTSPTNSVFGQQQPASGLTTENKGNAFGLFGALQSNAKAAGSPGSPFTAFGQSQSSSTGSASSPFGAYGQTPVGNAASSGGNQNENMEESSNIMISFQKPEPAKSLFGGSSNAESSSTAFGAANQSFGGGTANASQGTTGFGSPSPGFGSNTMFSSSSNNAEISGFSSMNVGSGANTGGDQGPVNPFGSTKIASGSSSSLFASSSPSGSPFAGTPQQTGATSAVFGSPSAFGNAAATQTISSSPFGQQTSSSPFSNQPFQSSSGFGASPFGSQQSSGFGGTANAFGNTNSSSQPAFGSQSQIGGSSHSGFGAPSAIGAFGAPSQIGFASPGSASPFHQAASNASGFGAAGDRASGGGGFGSGSSGGGFASLATNNQSGGFGGDGSGGFGGNSGFGGSSSAFGEQSSSAGFQTQTPNSSFSQRRM